MDPNQQQLEEEVVEEEVEMESGEVGTGGNDDDDLKPEEEKLEEMKKRLKEIEDEAAALREMQAKVEKEMAADQDQEDPASDSETQAEKEEAESRSIYVGNVDYGCTPEEVQQHFQSCGTVNRRTILSDKFGQPKGFTYVDAVKNAVLLNESELHGRLLKVSAKRTNVPGMKQYRARRPNPHLAFPFGGAYLPSYYSPYGYGRVVKEEMADMANNCSFLGINDKDEESILDTIFRKDSRKRLGKKTRKNTLLKKKDRRSRIRSGTWRRNLGREALAPMDAYDAYLYYEQQAAEKYANEMPEYARMGAAHVAEAEGDNGNEVEIDEEHFPLLFLLLFHLFPVIDEEAEFFPFIDEEAEAEDTEPESDEEYNDDTENGSQTDKEDSNAMGGDVEGYFVDKDDKEAEAEADERTDDK